MTDPMAPLAGLSPVDGKAVVAKFDGGLLSSDGGVLALREAEQRLGVADRLAACLVDLRAPDQITHSLSGIICFRLLMIAAGYEDGNDASRLRDDPLFKMAMNLTPSDRQLCSQSTISRLENLPGARALLRMGRAMVDLYCASPRALRPGGSQADHARRRRHLRCGPWRPAVALVQRPLRRLRVSADGRIRRGGPLCRGHAAAGPAAERQGGQSVASRRLVRAIRANWPRTEILVRADSHYCSPEVLDWCRANGLDYILGLAPNATLRRHTETLEASATARFEAAPKDGKVRRFKEFFDAAASWSRVERVIARVEAGEEGPDTRFIVTNLARRSARSLYEDVYCRRGQAENHIKSFKTHLAADRTSCTKASANQLRLFLHAGAYWLMWGLRESMPKRSMWRTAQFDTCACAWSKSPPASSK